MAQPLIAPLPPDLDLPSGYKVQLSAVDPTTGATVTGVNISQFSLLVTDVTGGGGSGLTVGPFMLVPGVNA